MEAVNIIADWLDEVETSAGVEWPFPTDALAAHVVSVLAASGHTIAPSGTGLVSQLRRLHYERPVSIAGSAWMTGAKSECGHCRREWPCATIAAIAEEDINA